MTSMGSSDTNQTSRRSLSVNTPSGRLSRCFTLVEEVVSPNLHDDYDETPWECTPNTATRGAAAAQEFYFNNEINGPRMRTRTSSMNTLKEAANPGNYGTSGYVRLWNEIKVRPHDVIHGVFTNTQAYVHATKGLCRTIYICIYSWIEKSILRAKKAKLRSVAITIQCTYPLTPKVIQAYT
jgi:hypothetical protein